MKFYELKAKVQDDVNPEGLAVALEEAADQLRDVGKLTSLYIHEVRKSNSGIVLTHRIINNANGVLHSPGEGE